MDPVELIEGRLPGQWQRVVIDEFGAHPRWGAIITCPKCARKLYVRDHTIDAEGRITPSVGHPVEYPACEWHTSPILLGWNPGPPPPVYPLETCHGCQVQSRSLSGWGILQGYLHCPTCMRKP